MFKIIDIDAFLEMTKEYIKSDDEVIAASIITPTQSVHAKLVDDKKRSDGESYGVIHDDIFNFIIGEIYDIGRDIDLSTEEGRTNKLDAVNDVIIGCESNYINIRWTVSSILFSANLSIPSFITKREYEYLIELNEKLKRLDIDINAEVINYNPATFESEEDEDDIYFDDAKTSKINLDIALNYLLTNGRIVDYDLPFGEERIIENPGKSFC